MNEQHEFKIRNPFLVIIWSFGLFILMYIIQYLGILLASLMSGASFNSIISGKFENHLTILGMGLNALIFGIPIVFLIIKYLWRRKIEWICLRLNLRLFSYGALLGLILPMIIVIILFIFGSATITSNHSRFTFIEIGSAFIGYLGLAIFTGLVEETVFRGMAAREIAVKWGWVVAAIISGIYFGLAHLLTNIQDLSILQILWIILGSILVGFLFTAMLVCSKSLWLPIGFHIGWNYSLKAFLGTTISGNESNFGILHTELNGSNLLTGGEFGLELSIVSLAFYILVTILLLKYSKKSKIELLSSKP